ncbi:mitogen-activated protein kinase kinase kinase 1-like isoform X2 [Olea europaea var. sylvestris]|uniref:mitogen-activated protein kinase kinase kinase 1-like isoform X2 n=1 Tax=Olea europaea var. sylvestris TaxID=158386 RepID=UPI000C1D8035|nr:mitogen-activated protein kinase kinase kinase 1-like isoform X2 [Olea europaea var. sylvestris]
MELLASTSSASDHHHRTQPLTERVIRALHPRLRLLHRSDSMFFVLGSTGNVYTVNLCATSSCTCPDRNYRTTPCKHILFVLIRALGVRLDDSCLWRRTLRPCQLNRLLNLPTLTEALASATLCEKFHRLFFKARPSGSQTPVVVEDGSICPVCLEEMGKEDKMVACGTCRNTIHEECFLAWKRSGGRRKSTTCVLCRARWREGANQEKYLNLSAYVIEDDTVEGTCCLSRKLQSSACYSSSGIWVSVNEWLECNSNRKILTFPPLRMGRLSCKIAGRKTAQGAKKMKLYSKIGKEVVCA